MGRVALARMHRFHRFRANPVAMTPPSSWDAAGTLESLNYYKSYYTRQISGSSPQVNRTGRGRLTQSQNHDGMDSKNLEKHLLDVVMQIAPVVFVNRRR